MNFITGMTEPLALGFSTGTWCIMYCSPVLLPFLLGREPLTHGRNLSLIGLFLAGRLFTYTAFGFVSGLTGLLAMKFFDPVLARRLSTIAYIFCGLVLLANGAAPHLLSRAGCRAAKPPSKRCRVIRGAGNDHITAVLSGLCVGLHICPPLWTAILRTAAAATPASGALYFILFYAGTLPFFLPLGSIPFIRKRLPGFRRIAQMTQLLVGGHFFIFAGLIPFLFRR